MSIDKLFEDVFNSLFIRENNNKTVSPEGVHNFSKFDGIFIVERLASLIPSAG